MFSTLMVRVQTIAQPAEADGLPAARYYGEVLQREYRGVPGGSPPWATENQIGPAPEGRADS
jgi:hypothetical protein